MHANSWSMSRPRRRALIPLLAFGVAACSSPSTESDPAGQILARFDGQSISAERLNQTILGLPSGARPKDPAAHEAWYGELLRQIAIHDLLVAQARRDALLSEPEIAAQAREAHRQILVSAFLNREISVPTPTEEEVERFYERRRDSFNRPERREVFHIFLRPEPGESQAALAARVQSLRDRSLAGEPFPLLAREYSQSQLRHDDGAMGWISPGQLAPRLNDIVFGLEEGVPSEVLLTESGGHLFLAATIVEARASTMEEAQAEIRRSIHQERQNRAVADYLAAQERDPADFAPSVEELSALMAGGDPGAVVQRVGDWTLTAGELLERLEANPRRGPSGPADGEGIFALLQSLASLERVFQEASASGLAEEPDIQDALTSAADEVAAQALQHRRLLERLEAEPEPVRAFFREQGRRFAGPLRLRVARLSVPVGPGSGRVMKQLEDAGPGLVSGVETLESLAARVGGVVHDPQWSTLADLQAEGGRLRGRLAAVPVGGFSEPVSNGREIEVFHVRERSEPEVPDFEDVRDAVYAAYLQAHGEEIYASFVEDELARSGFEIVPGSLARFAERASGVMPRATVGD